MERIAPSIRIDRSSPVPLYFQVAQRLEQMIESGEMPPGSRLENEIALADQLGLSRPTMRQAIQHLVDKGLLVRKRGVGTQVVNNSIGTDISGTLALGNAGDGVLLNGAVSSTIGGLAPGSPNVISGNAGDGCRPVPR